MRAYFDYDHSGGLTTRQSRTRLIIFLNSSPIYWFLKRQTLAETSSFGSEFIAIKQCCEYVRAMCYNIRMAGTPMDLPTYITGYTKYLICNTSKPHSILKNKSSSIAFHFIREGTAKDEWKTAYINTHLNTANILTKLLSGG